MRTIEETYSATSVPVAGKFDTERWQFCCHKLLSALPAQYASAAERLLNSLHTGGSGLRDWVSAIAWRGAMLPAEIPAELIEVYLHDPQAAPLHDCEDCGLAVPVRPSRLRGLEGEPDHAYFPQCPCCGGRTGWYMFWSTQAEPDPISAAIQRRKPR